MTTKICDRSAEGQARMDVTVWSDNRSSGMGSIHDNKRELAIHKSGMAGLDGTCCGLDAPRAPASRKRSDWLAGVSRRAAETIGVVSSVDDTDGDVPTGMMVA